MRWGALGIGVALVAVLAAAGPAVADDTVYPTWQDVQNAQASAAATQAEVTTLTADLAGLQTEAATTAQTALDRGADASRAEASLAQATAVATRLTQQADAALATAQHDRRLFAAFVLQLDRAGGTAGVAVAIFASDPGGSLLHRLTTAAALSRQSSSLAESAAYSARIATAARGQARRAEAARVTLADAAAKAKAAAEEAAASAAARVSAAQQQESTLIAQLATLQNQSADVQRRYQLGVQVRAQLAAQAAASAAQAGSATTTIDTTGVVNDPAAAQAYAAGQLASYGWASSQFSCLKSLWTRESGWRTSAYNTSSGAYGIPQALPGRKMAAAGADWVTNAHTQIDWGLGYISARYDTPCGAWAHETGYGWY